MTRILITILVISLISCGGAKVKKETDAIAKKTNPNWKTFNAADYSIQYPSGWQLDSSGQMGTSMVLLAPAEGAIDKFKENINLIVQDLSGRNIDLDEYASISEKQIKTMVSNSTMIESRKIKNENYYRLIFKGDQNSFHLEFEQYYWVNNNKAYVLTFTAEQDKFAAYKEDGEGILNSFTLK